MMREYRTALIKQAKFYESYTATIKFYGELSTQLPINFLIKEACKKVGYTYEGARKILAKINKDKDFRRRICCIISNNYQ